MSEQGAKPEVLPGDLITRPGLYEARCGEIVPITGWDNGWWVSEWDGVRDWYASDGRRRFYEAAGADEWQLLHWVAPLLENMPERVTTTEQLAEIDRDMAEIERQVAELVEEAQQADYPQPEPEPVPQPQPVQVREGRWRTRGGDIRNVTATPESDGRKERYPWWDAQWYGSWTADGRYHFGAEGPLDLVEYVGPIEPQPEQKLQAETEAQPETQPQPIQVREGLWRQADGGAVAVRPTSDSPSNSWKRDQGYVWSDGARLYLDNGRHSEHKTTEYDLVEYLGPIQRQSEPQPQPIQVHEGRWRTRAGEIVSVSAMPTDDDNFSDAYPWWDGDVETWANDGVFFSGYTAGKDLVEYLGPIEQPGPEPESDSELRIRLLKEANDNQAETIGRLQSEAHELNMEIGGLQGDLSRRDARIRDLETIYSAATKSFEDANKANDALRVQVRILQQEASKKNSRIEFLETLDAGNAVQICDYKAKVEKLQGLIDTARQQLEAAATERDELRAAIDAADKQLDQKDAQIRDLRIELDAAQQVPQPVSDEERERIWDEATEAAGRQVVRWLRPLTRALHRQPDERFSRFMALTLSVLPDVLPELLGYAVEDESLDTDEDGE